MTCENGALWANSTRILHIIIITTIYNIESGPQHGDSVLLSRQSRNSQPRFSDKGRDMILHPLNCHECSYHMIYYHIMQACLLYYIIHYYKIAWTLCRYLPLMINRPKKRSCIEQWFPIWGARPPGGGGTRT